jgi:acyl CoA:acetate/3-ketoacid CoA transferase beta subunit
VPASLAEVCIAACAETWRGDGEILASAIGTIPRLAAGLARATFEPRLLITDGEARLVAEPVALGAQATVEGWMPFQRVFDTLWSGRRHVMMGAAQIDRHGNTNISSIGASWQRPDRQLLGMRGAPGNTISHPCSFWIGAHRRRVFVERVDVVSGLGYDPALWPEGVRRGSHEIRRVVTNLAVLDFEAPERAMRVRSLHPGVTLEQVQAETGFELAVAPDLGETPEPGADALRIIREVLDPENRRDREVRV